MLSDPGTGDLKFNGVPPGRYRLQFSPRRGYVASATANGVDLLRDPLVVGLGAASSAISIILRDDTGTITGTVSGGQSHSRSTFANYVMAFPVDDDGVARPAYGNAQPDGKFTISNVVPGRYLIVAGEGQPPSLPYRNKNAMKAHEAEGALVDVAAGQTVSTSVKSVQRESGYGEEVED